MNLTMDENTAKVAGMAVTCMLPLTLLAGFALVIWVIDGCQNPFRRGR